MRRRARIIGSLLLTAGVGVSCCNGTPAQAGSPEKKKEVSGTDIKKEGIMHSVAPPDANADSEADRYTRLTEDDFRRVANELQVEIPAIKAVVRIEAGEAMEGFWAPGVPVVNYDKSMWASCRKKVTSQQKAPSSAKIPGGLKSDFARRAWQKLINARKINEQQANMSTFWGMFQIGGFNYKLCGCETIDEFVKLMSYSELEQLELFAALIENCGMVGYLRKKDWAGFARRYNGPSYARRGYHTRMAAAYKQYCKQTNQI